MKTKYTIRVVSEQYSQSIEADTEQAAIAAAVAELMPEGASLVAAEVTGFEVELEESDEVTDEGRVVTAGESVPEG